MSSAHIMNLSSHRNISDADIAAARASLLQILPIDLRPAGNLLVGLCPFHDERSPSFYVYPDRHYHCLTPETPVLKANLAWSPLGDLVVGDMLLAFDEHSGGRGFDRRFRASTVLAVGSQMLDCTEWTLSNGRTLIGTSDHQWLTRRGRGRNVMWMRGGDDRLTNICDLASKETRGEDWISGYMAGLLDGEGSLLMRDGNGYNSAVLTFTQKAGIVLDTFQDILSTWKIRYSLSLDNRNVYHIVIGGKDSVLRLLSKTRPPRLMAKWKPDQFGGIKQTFGERQQEIVKNRKIGRQQVVTIATSTRTFIADGLASHNCFGCGEHGDAITYLRKRDGLDFAAAVGKLAGGPVPQERSPFLLPRASAPRHSLPRGASFLPLISRLWAEATSPGLAHHYLATRNIPQKPLPEALRGHPAVWCRETGETRPAMLAAVRDGRGTITAIQRTWIEERLVYDGSTTHPKGARATGLSTPKMTLGPMGNGAVRLAAAGEVLGIAESVEDALAAAKLFRFPVWASCGAARMGDIELPDCVGRVIIFADSDEAGRGAAAKAESNYRRRGYSAQSEFPGDGAKDFAEMLQ